MRHKKSFNHLGRKSGHRKAMLANMASSLIMHKRIETTTAKAKALKRYVEPLVTRSKEDNTHSRRVAFSYLQNKEAVAELFREVGAKVGDRPGGYTRIIKLGHRLGDNADMCLIELVDFNETLMAEKSAAKKSASRRRRGTKAKSDKPEASAAATKKAAAAEKESAIEEAVEEEAVMEEVVEDAIEEEMTEEKEADEVMDKDESADEEEKKD
ncbi:MAG: 50S ribosomal protein L17 [Bacteroidales bacterium]